MVPGCALGVLRLKGVTHDLSGIVNIIIANREQRATSSDPPFTIRDFGAFRESAASGAQTRDWSSKLHFSHFSTAETGKFEDIHNHNS